MIFRDQDLGAGCAHCSWVTPASRASQQLGHAGRWLERMGIPCFIVLHFAALHRYYFLQSEGLWKPWVEQVCQYHFPAVFAHFMSLCHILVILAIFHIFSLLYLLWWSVISDYDSLKSQMMVSILAINYFYFTKIYIIYIIFILLYTVLAYSTVYT